MARGKRVVHAVCNRQNGGRRTVLFRSYGSMRLVDMFSILDAALPRPSMGFLVLGAITMLTAVSVVIVIKRET